jgi:kynureninase
LDNKKGFGYEYINTGTGSFYGVFLKIERIWNRAFSSFEELTGWLRHFICLPSAAREILFSVVSGLDLYSNEEREDKSK